MSSSNFKKQTDFEQFALHKTLNKGISDAGFKSARPIQLQTIPAGLAGKDVLGLAQTGTGKTAAFALPILNRLLTKPSKCPGVLVLAPTRELATQIAKEFRLLSQFTTIKITTVYGGISIHKQISGLRRKPEIVIGCPGRVLDLIRRGALYLGAVKTLVLDEADHMFDMGFLPDIQKILSELPASRQNLLFSATMPKEIRKLANKLLNKPHIVELADSTPASTIDHALYLIPEKRKQDLLKHILNSADCSSAIVFTRTKHRARRLAEQLSKLGHRAVGLQGNMSQAQRDKAMGGFRTGHFDFLIATDIAARGIDVSNVSYVINFDVPGTPEAYTHRIGRTGRSDNPGIACTFVTKEDRGWVRSTERMIGAPIPRRTIEGFVADFEDVPSRSKTSHKNPRGSQPNRKKRSNRPKSTRKRRGQKRAS